MRWKLLHKPTGLYYGPTRSRNGVKSNLQETGSTYSRKPTINERPWFRNTEGKIVTTLEKQWKAVEVKL